MQSGTLDVANSGWSNEFAHALTWTLVHSLWVGASVALCLYGFLRLVNVRRARWRYAASAGALFSVPLVAIWTLTRELSADAGDVWIFFDLSSAEGAGAQSALWGSLGLLIAWADGLRAGLADYLAPLEDALALIWIVLAALALGRFIGGWALLKHDAAREFQRASPRYQARVARLARSIGLVRRVGLYWSDRAEVPMVVGVLRPKIVIPTPLSAEVERGALDLVLLHELAHVRRGDPLARTVEAFLNAVFVLHPILPWLASRVAREREHCCDDIALEAGGDRLGYVRSLAALESSRRAHARLPRRWWSPKAASRPALRATDGALLERIRRLTSRTPRAERSTLASACGGLFLGSAGLAMGALPTHDTRPGPAFFSAAPTEVLGNVDLKWTSAAPIFDAAQPARQRIGRMIVLARHDVSDLGNADFDGQPLKFVFGENIDFQGELAIDGDAGAPRPVTKVFRVRAIKSTR